MTTRRTTLAARLLLAHVLVVLTAVATATVVAVLIGPAIFHDHLGMAGAVDPMVLLHIEEAFRSAGLTAMLAGLAIAAVAALVASLFATYRLRATLRDLENAAGRVAAGDYAAPVRVTDSGRELESVASALNTMAQRVSATEATRRRMLTDLSHELRTPISAIDLLLEGVEDGVLPVDASTLAALRLQTERLSRLATDMRDVSAAEEGRLDLRLAEVALADLLDAAAAVAAPRFEASGIALERTAWPDARVRVDRARIGQVLDNVLRNAVQHTPPGGHVRLGASVDAGCVRVSVADDGGGIRAEDLPHVFERFFTGGARRHDQGAGTGVGLAISRAIAVAHGGTLTASSEGPGRGAEFVLSLPVGG